MSSFSIILDFFYNIFDFFKFSKNKLQFTHLFCLSPLQIIFKSKYNSKSL